VHERPRGPMALALPVFGATFGRLALRLIGRRDQCGGEGGDREQHDHHDDEAAGGHVQTLDAS
jgi:hypothetical protein